MLEQPNPIDLGDFIAGERPVPLQHTFKDSTGAVINLTGYQAKFQYAEQWGTGTEANATVTGAAAGQVTYTWSGTEFATPGHYRGHMWAGNGGAIRYASPPIVWRVWAGVMTAPAI